jgi:hypothetical protein
MVDGPDATKFCGGDTLGCTEAGGSGSAGAGVARVADFGSGRGGPSQI